MKLKLHLESQSNSEKACFSIYLVKRNNGDRKSAVFTHAKPKENLFFFFFSAVCTWVGVLWLGISQSMPCGPKAYKPLRGLVHKLFLWNDSPLVPCHSNPGNMCCYRSNYERRGDPGPISLIWVRSTCLLC